MKKPAPKRRVAGAVVAWLHVMQMEHGQETRRLTFERRHPFGVAGRDFSKSYKVVSTALVERQS